MLLGIFDILVLFLLFCLAWILTSIAWKIIEGKMILKRQDQLMDQIYSKAIRLTLKFIQDFKDIKEVAGRDKM